MIQCWSSVIGSDLRFGAGLTTSSRAPTTNQPHAVARGVAAFPDELYSGKSIPLGANCLGFPVNLTFLPAILASPSAPPADRKGKLGKIGDSSRVSKIPRCRKSLAAKRPAGLLDDRPKANHKPFKFIFSRY